MLLDTILLVHCQIKILLGAILNPPEFFNWKNPLLQYTEQKEYANVLH
jgi:hypothetical protein